MRKRPFVKPGEGMLLGYARVSKGDEQSNALQAKALRAAGCRRIFEETASGGRWDRPEPHRMLDQLREAMSRPCPRPLIIEPKKTIKIRGKQPLSGQT